MLLMMVVVMVMVVMVLIEVVVVVVKVVVVLLINASLYKLFSHCGAMTIYYTRTLTTSSASQVLIDTWVGKGNLDSCYVGNQN